jgi:hypothetical protein
MKSEEAWLQEGCLRTVRRRFLVVMPGKRFIVSDEKQPIEVLRKDLVRIVGLIWTSA